MDLLLLSLCMNVHISILIGSYRDKKLIMGIWVLVYSVSDVAFSGLSLLILLATSSLTFLHFSSSYVMGRDGRKSCI